MLNKNIPTRNTITDLIPNHSIGCELGVFCGDFSNTLINSKKFDTLYLVDTFEGTVSSGDVNGYNIKTYSGEELLKIVTQKFKDDSRVIIEQSYSVKFLKTQKDSSFDFIYIDTVHTYDHLIAELVESNRIIKNQGLICGHDYHKQIFPGVVEAVEEFCKMYNYHFYLTIEDILASYIIEISK